MGVAVMQFNDEFLLAVANFLKHPHKKVLLINYDAIVDIDTAY